MKWFIAGLLLGIAVAGVFLSLARVPENTPQALAQGAVPATANIQVRNGPNPGEGIISWDAVPQATHYRIGYVNMEIDYHLAKASCTGTWIDAFVYVDADARNVPVRNGRAEYTIRHLVPGARHAFTVLTSNNFNDSGSGGSVRSEFFWPSNPRWKFLAGRNTLPPGVTLPTGECTATGAPSLAATPVPTPTRRSTPTPTRAPVTTGDYDADNDGLIEISNLAQLDAMRHDLDGRGSATHTDYRAAFPNALAGMGCPSAGCIGYELTSDLDFDTNGNGTPDEGDAYWNGNWGWTPIGDGGSEYSFNATFDGGGHTISNLYISWRDTNQIGLFRTTGSDAVIQNVRLVSSNVFGHSGVGELVGRSYGSIISNSFSTGTIVAIGSAAGGLIGFMDGGTIAGSGSNSRVTANGSAGGLVGKAADDTTITDSYAAGNVASNNSDAGGLVALIGNNANIVASYATGIVSGGGNAGGLVATIGSNAAVTGSYATGNVSGKIHFGGLIGHSGPGSTITASYATSDILSHPPRCNAPNDRGLVGSSGGLIGNNFGTIAASYAIGSVSGTGSYDSHRRTRCYTRVGGLLGNNDGAVRYSYWDPDATGQTASAGGASKTTRELQSPTGATGIYGTWDPGWWDFGTSRQYPVLKYRGLSVAAQR